MENKKQCLIMKIDKWVLYNYVFNVTTNLIKAGIVTQKLVLYIVGKLAVGEAQREEGYSIHFTTSFLAFLKSLLLDSSWII